MKDPGPNLLEQHIETNRLLALIAAAAPGDAAPTVLSGGGVPIQWPILFYFSNPSSNPFKITHHASGGSGKISFLDRHSINAGAGLLLETTAGGGTGHWTQMEIDLPTTPSLAIRLQVAFAALTESGCIDWYFNLNRYDLTSQHEAEIKLLRTSAEGFYLNSAGNPITLGTHLFQVIDGGWNKLDLVIDFAADKYHWVAVNQHATDLSAQSLKTSGVGEWPKFTFFIKILNQCSDEQAVGLIDQILITDRLYSGPPE